MLAHELSHVAHRDVLVMTIASSAGIVAGMLTRGAQFGGLRAGRPQQQQRRAGVPRGRWPVSTGRLRRQLLPDPAALALPRAVRRPVGRLPHDEARSRWPRRCRRSPARWRRSRRRDLRASNAMNAFFIAPAISGASLRTLSSTHPSLEQRLEQLARIQAELCAPGRRAERRWVCGTRCRAAAGPRGPNLDALFGIPSGRDHARGGGRVPAHGRRFRLLPRRGRGRVRRTCSPTSSR